MNEFVIHTGVIPCVSIGTYNPTKTSCFIDCHTVIYIYVKSITIVIACGS